MKSVAVLVAAVSLLAPASAHTKGTAVAAIEVCGTQGCAPAPLVPEVDRLIETLWITAADGDRHVISPRATPSVEVRITPDQPHTSRGLVPTRHHATVQIAYAPSINAVRMPSPPSKGQWARVTGQTRATLERLTTGIDPAHAERPPTATAKHHTNAPNQTGGTRALAAGVAALGLVAVAALTLRRRH